MSQVLTDNSSTSKGSQPPVLQVKDLSVSFSKSVGIFTKTMSTQAVSKVSFELDENEIMSLVGESGCGKTTIARCIAGLNEPTSGSIIYKGVDIANLRGKKLKDYRKEVQIAFQDPFGSLNPRLNVLTFLSIPIKRLIGEKNPTVIQQRVMELLNEVGLDAREVLFKLPHHLSGGERQRVNIARALASNPSVLVLDEPVSMLDATRRLDIMLMLSALKAKRKLSILLITHDLATAMVMGGRLAIIYSGKLVEMGPTEDVMRKPHHPYSDLLLTATPRMHLTNNSVDYASTDVQMSRVTQGCVFRLRCKYATSVCEETEPHLQLIAGESYVACHHKLN